MEINFKELGGTLLVYKDDNSYLEIYRTAFDISYEKRGNWTNEEIEKYLEHYKTTSCYER